MCTPTHDIPVSIYTYMVRTAPNLSSMLVAFCCKARSRLICDIRASSYFNSSLTIILVTKNQSRPRTYGRRDKGGGGWNCTKVKGHRSPSGVSKLGATETDTCVSVASDCAIVDEGSSLLLSWHSSKQHMEQDVGQQARGLELLHAVKKAIVKWVGIYGSGRGTQKAGALKGRSPDGREHDMSGHV